MKRGRRPRRRRFGRADARSLWRVRYRGGDFGFIAAHDSTEARAIARDMMPARWDRSQIDVEKK